MTSILRGLLAGLTILLWWSGSVWAGLDPDWLKNALAEAERDGYRLLKVDDYQALAKSYPTHLLLDVRTAAEFREGRLPGAVNMEFGPSEAVSLVEDKKDSLLKLLGPDPDRLVIIYDASLTCPRAAVAAGWAVRLGYRNVRRLAGGYRAWADLNPDSANRASIKTLGPGDELPDFELKILSGKRDREYLGLEPGTSRFSIHRLTSPQLAVWIFNELCLACQNMAPLVVKFHNRLMADQARSARIKIIGLGIGSKNRRVIRYRRTAKIPFPLFTDQCQDLHQALGGPVLPGLVLLTLGENGRYRLKRILSREFKSAAEIHEAVLAQ